MRDPKEALRRQVAVLEEELATKAEIARLEAERAAAASPKPAARGNGTNARGRPAPPEPLDIAELRIGKRLAHGTIRYVVRPIEWIWVTGMACVGGLLSGVVLFELGASGWPVLAIFGLVPWLFTFNGGIDIDPVRGVMRVWEGLGPIRRVSFTVPRVMAPRVRVLTSDEGGRSRNVYWGSNYVRTTLPPAALDELLAELRRLEPPRRSKQK